MEHTTNLKLPLLIPNQSGKEITHNEALVVIDNILQNGVISRALNVPPTEPNNNDIYIVGSGAAGLWAGRDNQLAFYDNGWRFIEPREGFVFWINDEDKLYTYDGSNWIETIASAGGGTSNVAELDDLNDVAITSAGEYDVLQHDGTNFTNTKSLQHLSMVGVNTDANTNNKLSVKSDYVLFDNIGGSSKVKVNKATATNTASYLFQNGYEGRAEFGLIGNDNFTLKVSDDGETWSDAFVVDKGTGNIDFKGNITKNGNDIIQNKQWVSSKLLLSTSNEIGVYEIDLSSYLPNDNNVYEVLIGWRGYTSTPNAPANAYISSDIITSDILIGWCFLGIGTSCGTITIPVGSRRYIKYSITVTPLCLDTGLFAYAYKRA